LELLWNEIRVPGRKLQSTKSGSFSFRGGGKGVERNRLNTVHLLHPKSRTFEDAVEGGGCMKKELPA